MFKCVKTNVGTMNVPETVFLPVKENEAVSFGEALTLSGGTLTKATTTAKYIALKDQTGGEIPCMRVNSDDVFECEITVALDSCVLGDTLALSQDGLNVAAKSDSGKVEIVKFVGEKSVGEKIHIRFN